MPKGYTTKQAIENYTLQKIADGFNAQLDAWIESIEAYIEQQTGRIFIAGEEATTRLYDGDGTGVLLVDDFILEDDAEVEIKIDGEAIALEDVYFYPANSEKKNKIVLDGLNFNRGKQNISITALWGYSKEVPADIVLACTILVAGIMAYSDGSKGKVRSESVGRYSVSYATDEGWNDFAKVSGILDSYKKFELNP